MNHQKSELYFLLAIIIGVSALAFFIFKPFIYILVLAIVFATFFDPIHKRILSITKQRIGLSAFLSTAIVFILVLIPITFLAIQILREATDLYIFVTQNNNVESFSKIVFNQIDVLKNYIPIQVDLSFDLSLYLKSSLSWLIKNIGGIFSNIVSILASAFIFMVSLFVLFKDGEKLKSNIIKISPLRDVHGQTIISKVTLAINSVIKGSLSVAIIQGLLTGTGLTIFGVPNSILLGCVAVITALIPGVGTSLVLIPSILYLLFIGKGLFALGLMIWGIVAVGLIDNVLGPKLVGKGTNLHSFIVFLSIIGGLTFFGPLGFLFGPLVLSLLFVLVEVYFNINKEYKC